MEENFDEIKWHKIASSKEQFIEEVPLYTAKSLYLGLKKICLLHTERGLYALEDACPHKLIKLSKGKITADNTIICPWHEYTFDICTGQEVTGKNIRPAKTYTLQEREDGMYVGIPEEPERDEFSF